MTWRFSDFTRDNPRDTVPRMARYTNTNAAPVTGWVVNTMRPTPELTRYLFVESLKPESPTWVATPEQIVFLPA
jgi:hypothetical protein